MLTRLLVRLLVKLLGSKIASFFQQSEADKQREIEELSELGLLEDPIEFRKAIDELNESLLVEEAPVAAVQDGDEVKDSQPAAAIEPTQPGGDARTLTEDEWSKKEAQILSAKDKEIATYRQHMAQQYIRRWGAQVQAAEHQAQTHDKGEVD